ncbi:MAG: aldose 1-epimerase family protein [Candidatus Dormibacterales bacterium]
MGAEPARPTGKQFELCRGRQRAVVVEVGGGIRTYVAGGRAVLDGYRADAPASGARGQVLIPWPNRLDGGRYTFEGVTHEVPQDDPATGCAIHGLVRRLPWRRLEQEASRITLGLTLGPGPGYPFQLALEVRYGLEADGLEVRTRAANRGPGALPLGAGQHPYVSAGPGRVDALSLELPAGLRLEADARGLPTGRRLEVAGGPYDFLTPRVLGPLRLDDCFTGLERDAGGVCHVRVSRPDGTGAVVWMDAAYGYVMVFSGDTLAPARRRRGLAVEPMTCPPDALASGEGLAVLAPGEERALSWGIRPL